MTRPLDLSTISSRHDLDLSTGGSGRASSAAAAAASPVAATAKAGKATHIRFDSSDGETDDDEEDEDEEEDDEEEDEDEEDDGEGGEEAGHSGGGAVGGGDSAGDGGVARGGAPLGGGPADDGAIIAPRHATSPLGGSADDGVIRRACDETPAREEDEAPDAAGTSEAAAKDTEDEARRLQPKPRAAPRARRVFVLERAFASGATVTSETGDGIGS